MPNEGLTSNLHRQRFTHLPTPIEELANLRQYLLDSRGPDKKYGVPRLLVKRDDQTGLATGGNKARKLEFLVAAALEEKADTLVTCGAVQSNHSRQTAAAAARYGLRCELVLQGDPPTKEPTCNLLLCQLMGAEVCYVPNSVDLAEALTVVGESLKAKGHHPYVIPLGGSDATGSSAYVAAMEELMQQMEVQDEQVNHIVLACKSGGTQAGLAVGARELSFAGQILGISIDENARDMKKRQFPIANRTAKLLGLDQKFRPDDLLVNDDYTGQYGVMGERERHAIRTLARSEGLLLDPVYTSRAFGGLLDLVRKGTFEEGETVLFWHTGGSVMLFESRYLVM